MIPIYSLTRIQDALSDSTTRTSITLNSNYEWQLIVDLLDTKEPVKIHFIVDAAVISVNHADAVRIPVAVANDLIADVKVVIETIRNDNLKVKVES